MMSGRGEVELPARAIAEFQFVSVDNAAPRDNFRNIRNQMNREEQSVFDEQ